MNVSVLCGPFCLLAAKYFLIIRLSCLLIIDVPDEGYSRNMYCTQNLTKGNLFELESFSWITYICDKWRLLNVYFQNIESET